MNAIQQKLLNPDTLFISIPPDRFVKSCHDTTIEGKSIIFQERSEIQSLFTGHLLRTGHVQPHAISKYTPDWILALLLLCFIILAWVQFFYRKRFRQLILAFFSKRFMNQLVREGNPFNERLSLALGMIYFISTAMLIFAMNDLLLGGHTPFHIGEFSFYLLILLGLVIFWLVKILTIRLLGTVFKTENTTRMYLLDELILNIITGLILIPILILVIYLKSILFLYISLSLIILSFLFLVIRGFMTGLSLTKFSYIFLFVYLCTLEILPLIIMVKFSLIFYNSMISVK